MVKGYNLYVGSYDAPFLNTYRYIDYYAYGTLLPTIYYGIYTVYGTGNDLYKAIIKLLITFRRYDPRSQLY